MAAAEGGGSAALAEARRLEDEGRHAAALTAFEEATRGMDLSSKPRLANRIAALRLLVADESADHGAASAAPVPATRSCKVVLLGCAAVR
eukprot:SAG31_NODE_4422_length_3248_cov_5.342966_1_plen_90_part_00